ncbi:hypothetical protein MCOR19_006635 [Pyricularia oryzae]|nr:hypothetical protein MCOR19_006635 [Pyricularia oryzae]KAI6460925.1 hypothetical protein MCOR15_005241 [Pyricularia oryzae]KAI6497167.1 hypothetical protein MCOR18_000508 [Pyricularia oryzae]KAI6516929.1 hypothetical protein MCOR16_009635 [Pyricularia oryzae]
MISLYRKIQQQKSGEQGVKQQQPSCAHQRNGSTATCERPNAPTSGKSGQGLQQSSPAPVAVTASDAEPERHPTPQSSQIKDSKCEACVEEKRAARKYRLKLVLGLIFPFALQALDVTIVASALPWIAKDFNEISQLNWIISAFNLTSAAFIPFWGQMADVFGRHAALQATVIIMMIGSAFCTAAPTDAFPVLLLGRGIQGLGCAGISVIVRVIIADKVSLKENAKNWSIFSFTAGMSYAIGPVIGGYLTTAAWRWCFAINLPICVVAIAIIFLVLRKDLLGPVAVAPQDAENIQQQHHANEEGLQTPPANQARLARFYARLVTVDVGGQLLFLFGFGLVVLAMTWAGATYAWNSAAVLAPLLVGVALVVAFVFWERLMAPGGVLALRFPRQKAMLPWDILKNKDVGLLCFINFATGAAMYSVLYFCSIYFTMVKLYDSGQAGVQLLYYTPGLGAGVYLSMFLCNRYPRNTFVPTMFGSIVEAVGVGMLAWALYHEDTPTIYGMMALTGVGTGVRFLSVQLHVIGVFRNSIATVVSLMAVTLPFGGTLGLTIMTTVFNNESGIGSDSPVRNFDVLHSLPEAQRSIVTQQAKMGVVWAFVSIVPIMILCVLAASLLGNVEITHGEADGDESSIGGGGAHVFHGVYLLHLLRRRRDNSNGTEQQTELKAVP